MADRRGAVVLYSERRSPPDVSAVLSGSSSPKPWTLSQGQRLLMCCSARHSRSGGGCKSTDNMTFSLTDGGQVGHYRRFFNPTRLMIGMIKKKKETLLQKLCTKQRKILTGMFFCFKKKRGIERRWSCGKMRGERGRKGNTNERRERGECRGSERTRERGRGVE